MEWKNIYRGLFMGASDVVPGVSGGTIAVVLGIYDRLIAAINGFFSKEWKKHFRFLFPLGLGIVFAIFTLSRLMDWLIQNHSIPTFFFFIGLILGVLPLLFREAEARHTFTIFHFILLLVGIIIVSSLLFIKEPDQSALIVDRTFSTYLLLFFSGMLASAAMILPGISGSLILLIIGVYSTVIHAISHLEISVIAVTGVGILFGIIFMSKIIHYFFYRFQTATYAIIIGLVTGSIFVIFPGWPTDPFLLIITILAFTSGLFVAYILGKVEY